MSTNTNANTSKTVNGHRIKEGGYSSVILHAKRKRKRQEAEARQAAYDKLTHKEKLASLIPGGSKRQRARLEAKKATAKKA